MNKFSKEKAKKVFVTEFGRDVWMRASAEISHLIKSGYLSTEDDEYVSAPLFKRLILLLTDNCNLSCSYCFEGDELQNPKKHGHMTKEMADICLDYVSRHSPSEELFIN